jgi:hypothetical protein
MFLKIHEKRKGILFSNLASFLPTPMPLQSTHLSSTSLSSGANTFWDRF